MGSPIQQLTWTELLSGNNASYKHDLLLEYRFHIGPVGENLLKMSTWVCSMGTTG